MFSEAGYNITDEKAIDLFKRIKNQWETDYHLSGY